MRLDENGYWQVWYFSPSTRKLYILHVSFRITITIRSALNLLMMRFFRVLFDV